MKFTGYHRLYQFIYNSTNILCYTNFKMTEIKIKMIGDKID